MYLCMHVHNMDGSFPLLTQWPWVRLRPTVCMPCGTSSNLLISCGDNVTHERHQLGSSRPVGCHVIQPLSASQRSFHFRGRVVDEDHPVRSKRINLLNVRDSSSGRTAGKTRRCMTTATGTTIIVNITLYRILRFLNMVSPRDQHDPLGHVEDPLG